MNIDDLLKRVADHVAVKGQTPILLAENIWHAAKQSFMQRFGEGTMFPHFEHPLSFMVAGVPIVCDKDQPEANADGLLPVLPGDGSTNADRVLHQDGTSAAIADDATKPGPHDPEHPEPDPSTPQAAVKEDQPRPELDVQDLQTAEPTYLGGHTEGGQDRQDARMEATRPIHEDAEPVADDVHTEDVHADTLAALGAEPEGGFAAMSKKADEEPAA